MRRTSKPADANSTAMPTELKPTELKRITYVEDEPDIRSIVEIALSKIDGLMLDLCSSGPEAIGRTPPFNPHLIILDVMMPGMDGIETLKRLRDFPQLANTPVIFLTVRAMQRETDVLRSLGIAEVITKPFDPMTLPHRIQEIWQQTRSKVDAQ
jgi:two-component system OmpR family response regulator